MDGNRGCLTIEAAGFRSELELWLLFQCQFARSLERPLETSATIPPGPSIFLCLGQTAQLPLPPTGPTWSNSPTPTFRLSLPLPLPRNSLSSGTAGGRAAVRRLGAEAGDSASGGAAPDRLSRRSSLSSVHGLSTRRGGGTCSPAGSEAPAARTAVGSRSAASGRAAHGISRAGTSAQQSAALV